jgi:hypothetical protein
MDVFLLDKNLNYSWHSIDYNVIKDPVTHFFMVILHKNDA